jgi:hypothetical protein
MYNQMRPQHVMTVLALVASAALSACALTVPITVDMRGTSDDGAETFSGFATGYPGGILTIQSNRGASCIGEFGYSISRDWQGALRCSDGRGGAIAFGWTGGRGIGIGWLGGRRFTFILG